MLQRGGTTNIIVILEEDKINARSRAAVKAWVGYHFRSLVTACLLPREHDDAVALSHVLAAAGRHPPQI